MPQARKHRHLAGAYRLAGFRPLATGSLVIRRRLSRRAIFTYRYRPSLLRENNGRGTRCSIRERSNSCEAHATSVQQDQIGSPPFLDHSTYITQAYRPMASLSESLARLQKEARICSK